jgi:tetratricopeptide (TPR) repeat protein
MTGNRDQILKEIRRLARMHYLASREDEDEAKSLAIARHALSIAEAEFGPEDRETMHCLEDVAYACQRSKLFEECERHVRRMIAYEESTNGRCAPAMARLQGQLARSMHRRVGLSEARSFLEQAIARATAECGPDEPVTTSLVLTLGNILESENLFEDAVCCFKRVFSVYEDKYGPDNQYTLTIIKRIAKLYNKLCRFDIELPLRRRLLSTYERLGTDRPAQAGCSALLWMISQPYFSTSVNWTPPAFILRERSRARRKRDTANSPACRLI